MINDFSAELSVWWSHLLNPITKHFNVTAEMLSTKLRVNPDKGNSGGGGGNKQTNKISHFQEFPSQFPLWGQSPGKGQSPEK